MPFLNRSGEAWHWTAKQIALKDIEACSPTAGIHTSPTAQNILTRF
jgi:hypothetical protein